MVMVRVFIVLLFVAPTLAIGQSAHLPIDSVTKLITYEEVVLVAGVNKDELHSRAREWFARVFNSAKSVIQMDDSRSGKMIGKGSAQASYTAMGQTVEYDLLYTVSITAKDHKFRYEISSFIFDMTGPYNTSFVKTTHNAEKIFSDNTDEIQKLKLPDKFKKKAISARAEVSDQIATAINNTGRSLSESIKNVLNRSKELKSKDDF